MSEQTVNPSESGKTEREMLIDIWPDYSVAFEGTALQLIVEGLIPKDLEWPQAAAYETWKSGRFRYHLRRKRPAKHKGPMRSWLTMDYWRLSISVEQENQWHMRRQFERKAEELRAEYRRLFTPAGRLEWAGQFDRYFKAQRDIQFQAFKALVPGLTPPKRGRKPKEDKGAQQCS